MSNFYIPEGEPPVAPVVEALVDWVLVYGVIAVVVCVAILLLVGLYVCGSDPSRARSRPTPRFVGVDTHAD